MAAFYLIYRISIEYTQRYLFVNDLRYQPYTNNKNGVDRECLVQQEYEVDVEDVCDQEKVSMRERKQGARGMRDLWVYSKNVNR